MSNMRRITATAVMVVLVLGIWSSAIHSQKNDVSQSPEKKNNAPGASPSTSPGTSSAQSQPLGMSPEEKLVRDVYTRLMRYQSAAVDEQAFAAKKVAQPRDYLTFELRAIRTGAIADIYNKQVVDLITPGDGQVISITPNRLSKGKGNDPPHASYLVEWTTSAKRNGSASNPGNEKQKGATKPITSSTIAEMFARGGERFANVTEYTAYQVTVRLNGQRRVYLALVLYHAGPGKLGSYQTEEERSAELARVEILDNVTPGMNTVLKDESPYARSPWEKYSRSTSYLAVVRSIKETTEAGRPLIPANAPIGYLPGDDATPSQQDMRTLEASSGCPGLRILQDGNDVTDATTDVVVGQRINLSLEITPDGQTASQIHWSVPGSVVADYVVNYTAGQSPTAPTSASPTPLTNFGNDTLVFYWVDGQDGRELDVSCIVDNTELTARAFFNVKRPQAQISTHTGTIALDSASGGSFALHYGLTTAEGGPPGAAFTSSTTSPSGFTGDFAWVQVVDSTSLSFTTISGQTQNFGCSACLDTTFPYDTSVNTEDSPRVGFGPCNYNSVSNSDSFTMWLMFKPSGTSTIWVPLRRVDWGWSASAFRSGIGCSWSLNPFSNNTVDPPDADTTVFPIWGSNVRSSVP